MIWPAGSHCAYLSPSPSLYIVKTCLVHCTYQCNILMQYFVPQLIRVPTSPTWFSCKISKGLHVRSCLCMEY